MAARQSERQQLRALMPEMQTKSKKIKKIVLLLSRIFTVHMHEFSFSREKLKKVSYETEMHFYNPASIFAVLSMCIHHRSILKEKSHRKRECGQIVFEIWPNNQGISFWATIVCTTQMHWGKERENG